MESQQGSDDSLEVKKQAALFHLSLGAPDGFIATGLLHSSAAAAKTPSPSSTDSEPAGISTEPAEATNRTAAPAQPLAIPTDAPEEFTVTPDTQWVTAAVHLRTAGRKSNTVR